MSLVENLENKLPVLKIYPYSSTDGPGNRYSIYLNNCNLNCKNCHNPESINKCDSCTKCIPECESQAIEFSEGVIIYDFDSCTLCDKCIIKCDMNASPRVRYLSQEEILADIKRNMDFIRGVTFSGGEATLHYKILTPLIKEIKKLGLSVFVDTNGCFDIKDDFIEFINLVDKFMLDVKFYDNELHKTMTSVSNEKIINNLNKLILQKKIYEIRTVVFDNMNSLEEIINISALIKDENILYKIIPYHSYGVRDEYKRLFAVPSEQLLREIEDYLQSKSVNYSIV